MDRVGRRGHPRESARPVTDGFAPAASLLAAPPLPADLVLTSVAAGQTVSTVGIVRNDVSLGSGAVLGAPAGGALAIFGAIDGPIAGVATLGIAAGTTLYAAGPIGGSVLASFTGTGGTLQIAALYAPEMSASIAGLAAGDVLDIVSGTVTDAVLAVTGPGASLALLDEGALLATFALATPPAATTTFTVLDPVDGTRILLGAALPSITSAVAPGSGSGSLFSWGGGLDGAWSLAGNWRNLQGGIVSQAPGSSDSVTIAGPQNAMLVVAGNAAAASLTTQGLLTLLGSISVGTLGAGATAQDALLLGGNSQLTARTASLGAGVLQVAASGATLDVTSVASLVGGTLWVADGGVADLAGLALAGGSIRIGASGAVSVGSLAGVAGALTIGPAAVAEGSGTIDAAVANAGTILVNGTLALFGTLGGSGLTTVAAGGELYLPDGVGAGQQLAFQGASGTIELFGSASTCAASISGFGVGDVIEIASGTITQAIWDAGPTGLTGTLDLGQAGTLAVSSTSGLNGAAPGFAFGPDGLGGTRIQMVPCFTAGTRLACPGGAVAVEDLVVGDRLITAAGAARRVRWIGAAWHSLERLVREPQLRPVRIRKGALGASLPVRDLCLSPQHAIRVPTPVGVRLVPAVALVDSRSVVRCPPEEGVSYFHLELDAHDLVLAEGVPAETFLDGGPERRCLMRTVEGHATPSHAPCAPRLEHGVVLELVREFYKLLDHLPPPGAPDDLTGCIDAIRIAGSILQLEGWVTVKPHSAADRSFDVLVDGAAAGILWPNQWRADLDLAHPTGGRRGFSATLPYHPAASKHTLEVEIRPSQDRSRSACN